MKKINILFLITTPKDTGPGKVLINLIKNINRQKYNVFVGYLYNEGVLEAELLSLVNKSINFKQSGFFKGWLDILAIKRISQFISENDIQIVNTHLVRANIYGYFACRITKTKYLPTVHNDEYQYHPRNIQEKIIGFIEVFIFHRIQKILCVSVSIRKILVDKFAIDINKIVVIENGIDSNYHDLLDNNVVLDIPINKDVFENNIIFGTFARLEPQKNIKILLESILILKNTNRLEGKYFIIIGEGSECDFYKRFVDKNQLHKWISLIGYRQDIKNFYNLINVFVLPSLWEGTSIALLEALSFGLPVIISEVADHKRMFDLGVSGSIFSPNNPVQLADCIDDISFGDLNKIGKINRATFLKYYTSEIMTQKYEKIFKELTHANS